MFFRDLFALIDRRQRKPFRSQGYLSRPFGQSVTGRSIEALEVRLTPTGNIAITGVSLVDGSNHVLNSVSAGQHVYVHADFTTTNLPSNASYDLSFNVNGFTLNSSQFTLGAGSSGSQSWYVYWGSFIVTPGANQITATVDPDQSVAESSFGDNSMSTTVSGSLPTVGVLTYSVSQIRNAYGLNDLPDFGATAADGTGQTIAIVDEFNNPNIYSDLDQFDQRMNISSNTSPTLYQAYGASSSILSVFNQSGVDISSQIANSGTGAVPAVDPTGGWEGEAVMDVEWAHAIAPGAHIDLIETSGSGSFGGLFTGAATAAALPGVTVVSMSWIWNEGNWNSSGGSGELALDSSTFVTPSGHPGVTFLASSGDGGTPGGYPAFSPNVIAVGGTELTTNGNSYGSETAWSFPTPRTLNNGDASYSQTGSWSSQSGGFSGSYSTASAGANSSATWSTSISSSDKGWVGGVEVSATWVSGPGNATNATYQIYDGNAATGTLMGTVTIDQTKSPAGTADGNSQFQELGDYYPGSGQVTVVLNASTANGTVSADAIGIAPAWATGGAPSRFEPEPDYQSSVQNSGKRTSPDVAFDGSINSGVTCWQSGAGYDYAGTSLSAPCWAGIIAIVNQGLVAGGGSPLNSVANPKQALQDIYNLPASDFHDITTGYNGLFAGVGYDQLTGLGTPIANLLIPDMVESELPLVLKVTGQPPGSVTAGNTISLQVTAERSDGTIDTGYTGSITVSIATQPGNATLNGTLTLNAVNGVATFSVNIAQVGSGYSLGVAATGFASTVSNTFSVIAATPTVVAKDLGGVYTGQSFGSTATVTGIGNATVSGSTAFTYYVGPSPTGQGFLIPPANVGLYTVVATFTSGDSNYTNASSAPVTFSITAATPNVVAKDPSGTYTGQPFVATATVTGIGNVTVSGSLIFTYYVGIGLGGPSSATPPSNVGTYTVTAGFMSSDANYANATSAPVTFNIVAVTQAPIGTAKTVTSLENSAYKFTAADFGFSDPNNSPANTLSAVKMTLLPTAGALTDNGVAVSLNQFVSVTDINAGKLAFTPATYASGAGYAQFQFAVQSNGSTAGGGINVDPTPKTMTINVTNVAQAPVGTSKTITTPINIAYQLTAADFGFTDPHDSPPNTFTAIKFTLLSTAGQLIDNGTAVAVNQTVSVADVNGGKLIFTPAANLAGGPYFLCKFQVQDNGSPANGGVNLDPSAKILKVNLVHINHAPVGTAGTVTAIENTAYKLKPADFGFTDPNDSPANSLLAVKFALLSTAGQLTDNGTAVTVNQTVSAADISNGKLVFTPAVNLVGGPFFLCKFQVQDNGGTSNGGVNLDPTPKVLNVTMTRVNHAPIGTSRTVTTAANTAYKLKLADFGFTDPNDTPANSLLAVKFTLFSNAGQLTDNGTTLTVNQLVSAADISNGKLVFAPAVNLIGGPFFLCKFQVQDNGGTANGGVNLDPTPKVLNTTILRVNHAPIGTPGTVTIAKNTAYKLKLNDFGFTDPNDNPANALSAVKFTLLSTAGVLTDNGVAVTVNQFVSAADISSGKLVFTPAANLVGGPFFLFKFQVQDNGGTANGGVNLDPTPKILDVTISAP